MQPSFAWWCFARQLAPEQLARAAARIGYRAVDLVEPGYWPLLSDHGLRVAAIGGHDAIAVGLNQRAQHDRIEQEIEAKLELAVRWNIPNLICFSGNRQGLTDAEGLEATADGLRRLAPLAEQAGVTLNLELLNSKIDHTDYQADHTAWGVEVCRRVASTHVKLLYDIYHMQVMEGDIIRTIRTHHAHFGHYHTAGNPGRHELGAAQELNYPAILRAIDETGFTGYIAHEFIPTGDPIAALEEAYRIQQAAR